MADDKAKKKEDDENADEGKKSPLKWIILGVVLIVVLVGAGIFLAPKFMPPPPTAEAAAPAAPPVEIEEPPVTVKWPPFVVDVRDEQGGSRHIKLVLTLEAKNEAYEEQVRAFGARGRQAVLQHIRGQKFEEITASEKFEELQKSINEVVKESIGKDADGVERVQNVLITDLVAQ